MKIQKINLYTAINTNNFAPQNNKKQQEERPQIKSFNPPAYKDFNISFGNRLFRTPSNFFEFNQDRLPQSMKEYLNLDYDDRKNMPPAQMWKTVFVDVKNAKNFEEVKKLYPTEPLFENLKDYNGKAQSSVISQVQALSDEFETTPLFKDGTSNLGMYLLKKIYYDGKVVKEINKDFSNDINEAYQGLIDKPITNDTTRAYGIKFPNVAFWNSFVVTRDDFPYVYTPKSNIGDRSQTVHTSKQSKETSLFEVPRAPQKKKFGNLKDWEIDKISNAMVKGRGNKAETEKQMKKANIQNNEALAFVAKYIGEINSIVLDRLHVPMEMRDYFGKENEIPKTQQEKFKEFWQNPEMNHYRSILMKDTIKLFFNDFGADGNNKDFQQLLDYAHGIKLARLEEQARHDELQKDYEEKLAIFDEPKTEEVKPAVTEVIDDVDDDEEAEKLKKYNELLDDVRRQYGIKPYEIDTEQGKVIILSDLNEALGEVLKEQNKFLPKAFLNQYVAGMQANSDATEALMLTTILNAKGVKNLPKDDRLMALDKAISTLYMISLDYQNSHKTETRAAKQALVDAYIKMGQGQLKPAIFGLNLLDFAQFFPTTAPNAQEFILENQGDISKKYAEYKKPLTDYEIHRLVPMINKYIREYDPSKSIVKNSKAFSNIPATIVDVKYAIADTPFKKQLFEKGMTKYLSRYGGSARFLLNKKMPEDLKAAKFEELFCDYVQDEGMDDRNLFEAFGDILK